MGPTVRASAWRAGTTVLQREGVFAKVLERVPAPTAALMKRPSDTETWVDIAHFDDVTDALLALGGEALVRRIGRIGGRDAQLPLLRAIVRMLRVVGAGPHLLLGRLGEISRIQSRGVEVDYERRSDREAWVQFRYLGGAAVPLSRLLGMAGRLESLLDLAGATGTVEGPLPTLADSEKNAGAFQVRW